MDNVLEEIVKRIVKKTSPNKIILFGERAKDENKRLGDYDICVLKKGIKHKGLILTPKPSLKPVLVRFSLPNSLS